MHLRPVEAQQVAGGVVERQEQPVRVEPGFGAALSELCRGPAALLGMAGERSVVDPQQFGVVVPPGVGANPDAVGNGRFKSVAQ
jgi:hypothetical protein